jgi:hypothetical protein
LNAIIIPFLQIAMLRRKPQELPYSTVLLGIVLSLHLLLGLLVYQLQYPFLPAATAALTGTFILGALSYTLLYMKGVAPRFVQTLSALAGTDILIGLMSIPIITMGASGLSSLLYLTVLGWNLSVATHILRHALDVSVMQGFVFAIIFFMFTMMVLRAILPIAS